MSYVVTEACIRCKYTDCVDVCPVDCFHEGPNFLAIDPAVCIDCSLCKDECPVSAIYEVSELPPAFAQFVALNAELCKDWPLIKSKKNPLPDADVWAAVTTKLEQLARA